MSSLRLPLLALALLACALVGLAACGEEEQELLVIEGEPLELGEVAYTVQLTRFLNPDDNEDAEYLVGLPPTPKGKQYLGVFMLIENEGKEPAQVAGPMEVIDTRDNTFEPLESESAYALDLAGTVPAEGQLPLPDTTAASGAIKGSMVLFLVDDFVTENRPIDLEIPGPDGETGLIELDI